MLKGKPWTIERLLSHWRGQAYLLPSCSRYRRARQHWARSPRLFRLQWPQTPELFFSTGKSIDEYRFSDYPCGRSIRSETSQYPLRPVRIGWYQSSASHFTFLIHIWILVLHAVPWCVIFCVIGFIPRGAHALFRGGGSLHNIRRGYPF